MKLCVAFLCLFMASVFADTPARPRIELVRDVEPAYIVLAKTEHKGVMAAAKDLQRDITKISGVTPNIVHSLADALQPLHVRDSSGDVRAALGGGVAAEDEHVRVVFRGH